MPRPAKPWYRSTTNSWYVKVNGKQISLGVQGAENEADAVRNWHRLMANGSPTPTPKPEAKPTPEAKPVVSVQAVLDGFLADAEGRVNAECLRQYRKHLLPFARRYGERPAESITNADAEAFAKRPAWSASYRNGFLRRLLSAYRWAERSQVIARSPLQGLRKPPMASRGRKALVLPDTYATLCEHASPFFRAFLAMLWHTGARPGEIAGLRAEDVDLTQSVAVLPEHKCAHLGKSRLVFLSPEAVAVLRERLALHPSGLLFGGRHGQRLTTHAIGFRFRRLSAKAKVKAIAYGFRHTFATDALAKGVPDATVAALLGHSGTAMLHKHYAHLTSRSQALRDAMATIR